LFYDDVTLNYPVPVINQQGEIVGKLQVELAKISGQMDDSDKNTSTQSSKLENSLYEEYEDEEDEPSKITVKVTVRHLAGVSGSNYVFCQYVFCDNVIVVPPGPTTSVVRFDHTRYFQIPVSEEFSDYCSESALSIEVWGHRGNQVVPAVTSAESNQASSENNNNSVTDRWKEVTSQMKLWVEIQVSTSFHFRNKIIYNFFVNTHFNIN